MRNEFSAKTKMDGWNRCGGVCECGCGSKLYPGKYDYDHRIPCQLGGDNSLNNLAVLARGHHLEKTKVDIRDIAKAKRRERAYVGIRKPRTIRAWRRFNGEIVYAPRER